MKRKKLGWTMEIIIRSSKYKNDGTKGEDCYGKCKNMPKVYFSVILILFFYFLNFITPKLIFADSPITQETITKIKRKCAEAYPKELLIKCAMHEGGVPTDVGGFVASRLEYITESFSVFLKPGMKFLDLGSGDGRVVFFASLFGVEATGIEYDPTLYQVSIDAMGNLSDVIDTERIHLIKGDFLQHDFSDYDVFYLYEGTDDLPKLKKKLSEEMKPGSILINYEGEITIDKLNLIQEFANDDVRVYRKIR